MPRTSNYKNKSIAQILELSKQEDVKDFSDLREKCGLNKNRENTSFRIFIDDLLQSAIDLAAAKKLDVLHKRLISYRHNLSILTALRSITINEAVAIWGNAYNQSANDYFKGHINNVPIQLVSQQLANSNVTQNTFSTYATSLKSIMLDEQQTSVNDEPFKDFFTTVDFASCNFDVPEIEIPEPPAKKAKSSNDNSVNIPATMFSGSIQLPGIQVPKLSYYYLNDEVLDIQQAFALGFQFAYTQNYAFLIMREDHAKANNIENNIIIPLMSQKQFDEFRLADIFDEEMFRMNLQLEINKELALDMDSLLSFSTLRDYSDTFMINYRP